MAEPPVDGPKNAVGQVTAQDLGFGRILKMPSNALPQVRVTPAKDQIQKEDDKVEGHAASPRPSSVHDCQHRHWVIGIHDHVAEVVVEVHEIRPSHESGPVLAGRGTDSPDLPCAATRAGLCRHTGTGLRAVGESSSSPGSGSAVENS
jgi:hypothetical protein